LDAPIFRRTVMFVFLFFDKNSCLNQ